MTASAAPAADAVPPVVPPRRRWSAASTVFASVLATYLLVNGLVLLLQPYFMYVVRYDQQHTAARIVEYYRGPRPDVLFMGTSRALSGFDPSVAEAEIASRTGSTISAHNLALTGGAIELHYLILKNIITADKQPRVIVYGLTDSEFASIPVGPVQYLPYTAMLLRPDDYGRFSGSTVDQKIEFWVNQVFPLYRDRRLILDALNIAFNPRDPAHKFYADGPDHRDPAPNGYIPGSGAARAPQAQIDQNRSEYSRILPTFRFDYNRLDTFHQFLALAEQRGIRVVLVNMPVDAELRKLWGSQERVDEYRAMMQVLASDHSVPLLDLYRGWSGLPDNGLWDWHHLNEVGAGAVTRLVTETHLAPIFGGVASAPPADLAGPFRQPASASEGAGNTLFLQALYPDTIGAGQPFNAQPNGQSALGIRVRNATPTSVIVFAGTPLETVYAGNNVLTATVPASLTAAPGRYPVQVTDGANQSNSVDFVVTGR